MNGPTVIDARGHRCPTPSLKLAKAMRGAAPGARFALLASDPMARIDVPYLMAQVGGRLLSVEEDPDGVLRLTVETSATPGVPTD